jgi:cytochrome c
MSYGGVREMLGFTRINMNGMALMIVPKTAGSFVMEDLDLTGITNVALAMGWRDPAQFGYTFEIRLDSKDGQLLSQLNLPGGGAKGDEKKPAGTVINAPLATVNDGKLHKLVIISKPVDPKEEGVVAIQSIQFR